MSASLEDRAAFIQGLRDLAGFLEQHPQIQHPTWNTLHVFAKSKDELLAHAKGASWTKEYSGDWFKLSRTFGPDLTLSLTIERQEVCRRIVTGTRTIPAQPEQPAQEVEIVEWRCEEALLAPDAETVPS